MAGSTIERWRKLGGRGLAKGADLFDFEVKNKSTPCIVVSRFGGFYVEGLIDVSTIFSLGIDVGYSCCHRFIRFHKPASVYRQRSDNRFDSSRHRSCRVCLGFHSIDQGLTWSEKIREKRSGFPSSSLAYLKRTPRIPTVSAFQYLRKVSSKAPAGRNGG